jgi:hypothetical protein
MAEDRGGAIVQLSAASVRTPSRELQIYSCQARSAALQVECRMCRDRHDEGKRA